MFQYSFEIQRPVPLTYSLRGRGTTSDRYYRDVAKAADDLLESRASTIDPMLERFTEWIVLEQREASRSDLEYTFDILTLGVMWKLYGGRAQDVPAPLAAAMCALYRLRRNHPSLKRWIDPLRGVLASRFLAKGRTPDAGIGIPCTHRLRKLLHWMDATGEYREEVKRLHLVFDYLAQLDEYEREWHLENLMKFTDTFVSQSESRLGEYTSWVDCWLRDTAPTHRNAEDFLLCNRARAEYHLNMIGAELMNRAFAGRFFGTAKRAVLLPACMRGAHSERCKARKEDLDLVCTGCTADCRVNAIRRQAAEAGATTHIIPHSSDFTRWLSTWAEGRDIGVVGVACVLHLVTGGLELRSLDIPAQCVLLDHCGCTQHWDPEGRQTDLNGGLLDNMLRSA